MKKFKIIILAVFSAVSLIGCTDTGDNAIQQTHSNETVQQTPDIEITSENSEDNIQEEGNQVSFVANKPQPIDDAIKDCYFTVRAKYKSNNGTQPSPLFSNYSEYTFEYIDSVKGNYNEESITVIIYDLDVINSLGESVLKEGEEYILFLDKHDDLFQGIRYTLRDSVCMHMDGDNIAAIYKRAETETYKSTNADKAYDFSNIDELKRHIANLVQDTKSNNEENVVGFPYILSDVPEEIVEFSPHIVKVVITEKIPDIPGIDSPVSEYRCETKELYKGTIPDKFILHTLSDSVEIGEEYLLLLVGTRQPYIISSFASCISVNNEEMYDAYMKYVH